MSADVADDRKHLVIITSLGRTGTLFFGERASRMIPGSVSFHEADVLIPNQILHWREKFRGQSLLRITLGKLSPRSSLATLGVSRVAGRTADAEAVRVMRSLRDGFFAAQPAPVVVEANLQYADVADLVPLAFPLAKTLFIVRDPRPWVRSWMNWPGGHYTWRDVRSWLPHLRLAARHLPGRPLERPWSRMTVFEKLCWAWGAHHGFVLPRLRDAARFKVVRFEDLFQGARREQTLREVLEFACAFPDGYCAGFVCDGAILDEQSHAAAGTRFPGWREWDAAQARTLEFHCGALLRELGYGAEPEWRAKVS